MTKNRIDFLVAATGSTPRTLLESIRQVSNASSGFCRSWIANDISDALATSEEAFERLDHIQNELLRHRDKKSKLPGWSTSLFKAALNSNIGQLLDSATESDKAYFLDQVPGSGAMPQSSPVKPLTLEVSLNKLKHRDTNSVNFTVSSSGEHVLYIFTCAGMQRPDSISSFNIHTFCSACKAASQAI